MDTLFSNVTIVTMDEAMHVYFDAYLGVTEGKISYLAREAPEEKTKRLVPGEGMVLMPGLINCHTHLPMSVLRGYADDVELSSWLNDYIFPHEDRLDGRSAKAAALLSIAECVRFGTTSISDMYNFCDEIAEAVAESGIKANIARGATLFGEDFDFETHPACRELVALKEKCALNDFGQYLDTTVQARAAALVELNSDTLVYGMNLDEKVYPASLTKIMTCMLALEHGNLDDIVTVSHEALQDLNAAGSSAGLLEGEQLSLRELLYCVMISSANEACNVVAEYIAGDIPSFVALMNAQAAALGMTGMYS